MYLVMTKKENYEKMRINKGPCDPLRQTHAGGAGLDTGLVSDGESDR